VVSGFLSAVFGLRVLQGDAPAAGTDPVLSSFRRGAQTAAEQPALHSPLGLLSGNALMEEENPSFLQIAAALHTRYVAGTATSGITLRAPSSSFRLRCQDFDAVRHRRSTATPGTLARFWSMR